MWEQKHEYKRDLLGLLHVIEDFMTGTPFLEVVFLLSKRLLSAFYKTLPFKNPSKNLVFAENPYRRLLRF